jgi:hypothetical protein
MLLFDDSKRLEKALGEEAAAVIVHVLEKAGGNWRSDLATKADLMEVRVEMKDMENRILRWMVGGFLTQTALLVAILAILR